MSDILEKHPVRVICCGELGKTFMERYGEPLKKTKGIDCTFVNFEDNGTEAEEVWENDKDKINECLILVAEYTDKIRPELLDRLRLFWGNWMFRIVVIHPRNRRLSGQEMDFLRTTCWNYDAERIALAMPEGDRAKALGIMCAAIYDIIYCSVGTAKGITLEVSDLTDPFMESQDRYALVFRSSDPGLENIIDIAKNIRNQINQRPEVQNSICAYYIFRCQDTIVLRDFVDFVYAYDLLENAEGMPEDIVITWSQVFDTDNHGMTVILYRDSDNGE